MKGGSLKNFPLSDTIGCRPHIFVCVSLVNLSFALRASPINLAFSSLTKVSGMLLDALSWWPDSGRNCIMFNHKVSLGFVGSLQVWDPQMIINVLYWNLCFFNCSLQKYYFGPPFVPQACIYLTSCLRWRAEIVGSEASRKWSHTIWGCRCMQDVKKTRRLAFSSNRMLWGLYSMPDLFSKENFLSSLQVSVRSCVMCL